MKVALVIILVAMVIQPLVWIPLIRKWRKQSDLFVADLRATATVSGERFIAGPAKAVYRGGSGTYSAVKGNGTIVLTDRRLLFRKLTGGLVEVPAPRITGVRQSKTFRGSRVGGATHLVVTTNEQAEVGFFVDDAVAWERALHSIRPT